MTAADLHPSRCCDYSPHNADEVCLYSGCQDCGGAYSFGLSGSPICYVCASADATDRVEDQPIRQRVPIEPLDDEEPF